jgi:hypothetical protein
MPRLHTGHLLAWVTISSFLALQGSAYSNFLSGLWVMVRGGCFIVSAIVVYQCTRHSIWTRTEPGHWFAFVCVWEYLDMVAVEPICHALLPIRREYIYCIAFIGMAAIYIVGAIVGRWQWYWTLAMSLLGLDQISSTGWRLAQEWWGYAGVAEFIREKATPTIAVCAVLATLASIGIDLFRKQYRDWLHWCGIAYFLLEWYGFARAYAIPYLFPPQRQPIGL